MQCGFENETALFSLTIIKPHCMKYNTLKNRTPLLAYVLAIGGTFILTAAGSADTIFQGYLQTGNPVVSCQFTSVVCTDFGVEYCRIGSARLYGLSSASVCTIVLFRADL
ncbi:MAG: hypothetical protein DI539_11680 [Flavobacterium psychrophilum]|nr:MAG: hypothetical protein DI539_11680 [Flavobacterium psychrophilum]